MYQERAVLRPAVRDQSSSFRVAAWLLVSGALHVLLLLLTRNPPPEPDTRPFELPAVLDFGLADTALGGGNRGAEPAPAKLDKPKARVKIKRAKPAADPNAYALARPAHDAAAVSGKSKDAADSGEGDDPNALGKGLGDGFGDGRGSGYAPAGATIALNVDLARVRKTALVLETQALLDIIPEWQKLLAGSGLEPLRDFERVFVASPTLERANVVVSARHHLGRAQLEAAVQQLASEQRQPARFEQRDGFAVAPWRNRGPTARVIALTGADQLTITRASDLARVLDVAAALARKRAEQGFAQRELEAQGGLLAMQEREAVALWVEGVRKYVRGEAEGVPEALRLSIYHVDQFNTELRVRGQYASPSAAGAAMTAMEALRAKLSDDPKVIYLGLKSAIDRAAIIQEGAALALQVRLTLHQTRYLMRYVTRALRPRTPAQ
jgi:hypothetical protein